MNPIMLNQGKPICIAIDRDLGLTELDTFETVISFSFSLRLRIH